MCTYLHSVYSMEIPYWLAATLILASPILALPIVLLPTLLNKKFDRILGHESGKQWLAHENHYIFGYFILRAFGFSRAMRSERFAQKRYGVSSNFLRSRIGWFTYLLVRMEEVYLWLFVCVFIPWACFSIVFEWVC